MNPLIKANETRNFISGTKIWLKEGKIDRSPLIKAQIFPLLGKVITTFFWESKKKFILNCLSSRWTLLKVLKVLFKPLKYLLRQPLIKSKQEKLYARSLLRPNNLKLHTAQMTKEVLGDLKEEIISQPSYSSSLPRNIFYFQIERTFKKNTF